jgi:CMP-N,N'-diacetyllegionaminic acid synthase
MIGGQRVLAVIPARGGSVSVPHKNIKPLCGRPLLAYTIAQAQGVRELDLTVVSTDDREIAAMAKAHGIRVIDRPAALATNDAPTEGALLHALDTLASEQVFDLVVVLEPTSPFRTAATIRICLERIAASDAPSLLTVCPTYQSLGRVENGRFRRLDPAAPRRRQERQPLYFECSSVYICRTEHLRRTGSLVADDWLAVSVPVDEVLDINNAEDFVIAEALMASRGIS